MLNKTLKALGGEKQHAKRMLADKTGSVGMPGSVGKKTAEHAAWRTVVESPSATRVIDKLKPSARRNFDKAIEKLARGEKGLNQHRLGRDRAGQMAMDIPGTGNRAWRRANNLSRNYRRQS